MNVKPIKSILLVAASLVLMFVGVASSHDEPGVRPHHIDLPANPTAVMRAFSKGKLGDTLSTQNLSALQSNVCDSNMADIYPCENIDLMAFMPLADMGATQSNDEANDIWGWADPMTGREYALIGRVFGTSFIDVSIPDSPVFVGELNTHGRFGSPWRDINVYQDYAFIVSEASRHGMQVFDLKRLREYNGTPILFGETAHYRGFGSAHNIVINTESGFAYAVGTNKCGGGLEMVDISIPTSPSDAGCYSEDGYTHDAQCLIYNGPDLDHTGKEICLASNEDTLSIVDVTNKSSPTLISKTTYTGVEYTHQGWLTEDQRFFLLDDELDEQATGLSTRTYVWDLVDLDMPSAPSTFNGSTTAIDHNQYIRSNCSFQANYRAGLRVVQFDPNAANFGNSLSEVGYFDIYPEDNNNEFNAAWSNYPYFESGTVIVSGIEQGLYVLKPTDALLVGCGISTTSNAAPTIAIAEPVDGMNITGSVSISVTADDAEDGEGTLVVEWGIDGGTFNTLTWVGGLTYSGSWDSNDVADGAHTVTVMATDSSGKTGMSSIDITTANGVVQGDLHVHSIVGTVDSGRGGKWSAAVTLMIYDKDESEVHSATVNGIWSNGASGSGICTTNASGACTLTKSNINRKSVSAKFTVDSVVQLSLPYTPDYHETDSITLARP